MKQIARSLRLLLVVLHLLQGCIIIVVAFGFLSTARKERLVRWWAGILLKLFGLRVEVRGNQSLLESGHMLVLNHVSWIDVYVVDAYRATRFVAKSEIRGWPLIGWMCERTDTIFIERGRRHAVHGVIGKVADALREGACVGVFPEGTTTNGTRLGPFHANLIQAAIDAKAAILPATICYRDLHGGIALAAAYIDDMTMWQCAKNLLDAAPLVAELTLLETMAPDASRRDLIDAARSQIVAALGLAA